MTWKLVGLRLQEQKADIRESINAIYIGYMNFGSKKTVGQITARVRMLKEKSLIVSEQPSGKFYRSLNIWVGRWICNL